MLFCCSIQNISSEIFTAQVELEALFELRQSVADGIKTYLDKEELRLQEIRNKFISSSGLNRIDCANENRNSEHRKSSLAEKINPINSFLTIKGLSKDLGEILLPALDKSNIQGEQ
jgi:hemerythrin-like domain-containing protein